MFLEVAREAGYTGFKFSANHARYILDAQKKRQDNTPSAPFWLFRLNEHKPQLGDLVCLRLQPGISFDNLPSEASKAIVTLLSRYRRKRYGRWVETSKTV